MTKHTTTGADAQRKMEGLLALASIAEREGRPEAAIELSRWATDTAPYQALTNEEILVAQRAWRTHRIGGGR